MKKTVSKKLKQRRKGLVVLGVLLVAVVMTLFRRHLFKVLRALLLLLEIAWFFLSVLYSVLYARRKNLVYLHVITSAVVVAMALAFRHTTKVYYSPRLSLVLIACPLGVLFQLTSLHVNGL